MAYRTQNEWKNLNEIQNKRWHAKKNTAIIKIPACTLPEVQLLLTECVIDVHYIPCKEHDDPQSNHNRAIRLVT